MRKCLTPYPFLSGDLLVCNQTEILTAAVTSTPPLLWPINTSCFCELSLSMTFASSTQTHAKTKMIRKRRKKNMEKKAKSKKQTKKSNKLSKCHHASKFALHSHGDILQRYHNHTHNGAYVPSAFFSTEPPVSIGALITSNCF